MSDVSIAIVPKVSRYPNPKQKAREILEWLIQSNIISAKTSGCTLGGEGYAVRPGAAAVVVDPFYLPVDLSINGIAIVTERQVFHAGSLGMGSVTCPVCNEDIAKGDLNFVDKWTEGESDNVVCSNCDHTADINQFHFAIPWGFSDLGFVCWNWPELTPAFVEEFSKRLACEVNIIYSKI
ncbi:MAG: hypothetical protein ABW007_16215 [Chitinophagaceae bacterium]